MPEGLLDICLSEGSSFHDRHDAILQALDRWIDYGERKIYLDSARFKPTVKKWDDVPVIFAQDHPMNFSRVRDDLPSVLAELKDYRGRPAKIVGSLKGTEVIIPGQPRLSSEVVFDDPDLKGLYDAGRLSLSTGFSAKFGEDGLLQGDVTPNHLLVFVQDSQNQPRDKAAMFLNSERKDGSMDISNAGRIISEKNRARFKDVIDALTSLFSEMSPDEGDAHKNKETERMDAMKMELDLVNKSLSEKETLITNKDQEIKTLKETLSLKDTEITDLKNKINEADTARKDASWAELKNKIIPPGMTDTPEKEKALRDLAESDPLAFGNKLAELKIAAPAGEEGSQHTGTQDTPIVNKGIGTWDARTGTYKD